MQDIRRNTEIARETGEAGESDKSRVESMLFPVSWQPDEHDFRTVVAGGVDVPTYETIGHRETHEDRYTVFETRSRDPQQAVEFLEDAFVRTGQKAQQDRVPDGAVAGVVYLSSDKAHTITTATIGDVRTVLLVRDKTTGKIDTVRLSREHQSTDAEEQARVRNAGGIIVSGRVRSRTIMEDPNGNRGYGLLAVPRAFGDLNYPGVTCEPSITQIQAEQYVNDPNLEVYVLNSSDGIYQYRKDEQVHEKDVARVLEEKLGTGPVGSDQVRKMPQWIVSSVLAMSGDNMTVTIVPVSAKQTADIIAATFDGHHGSVTAELAAQKIEEIAMQPPFEITQPIAEQVAEAKSNQERK